MSYETAEPMVLRLVSTDTEVLLIPTTMGYKGIENARYNDTEASLTPITMEYKH